MNRDREAQWLARVRGCSLWDKQKICACTAGRKEDQDGGRQQPGLALRNVPLKCGLGVGSERAETRRELVRAEEERMKSVREA